MERKEQITEAIKTISLRLQEKHIKWLIGGSGSLLVHGLEVTPNDIDLIIDPKDYSEAETTLSGFITGDTETVGGAKKTPFKVGEIEGELLERAIDVASLETINISGVDIIVYKLEVEYNFYKSRTDKIEANKKKIELMEKALGLNTV